MIMHTSEELLTWELPSSNLRQLKNRAYITFSTAKSQEQDNALFGHSVLTQLDNTGPRWIRALPSYGSIVIEPWMSFLPESKVLNSCHSVGCQELATDLVSGTFDSYSWIDILRKLSRMSPRPFLFRMNLEFITLYVCICIEERLFLIDLHLTLINLNFSCHLISRA